MKGEVPPDILRLILPSPAPLQLGSDPVAVSDMADGTETVADAVAEQPILSVTVTV